MIEFSSRPSTTQSETVDIVISYRRVRAHLPPDEMYESRGFVNVFAVTLAIGSQDRGNSGGALSLHS